MTFTRTLVADLLAFPELRGVELVLHDIDPRRLEAAEAMVRCVDRERGVAGQGVTLERIHAACDDLLAAHEPYFDRSYA